MKTLRDGLIYTSLYAGCVMGIMTIAFAWLIASGNASPTAYGSMVNAGAQASICYIVGLTLIAVKFGARP